MIAPALPHATLTQVGFDDVGRLGAPHFYRGSAFVVWVGGPSIAGIFATKPQRMEDLEPVRALHERLYPRPSARQLFCDLRGFGGDHAVLDAVLAVRDTPASAPMPTRCAAVLPQDWSRAWWVGIAEMRVLADSPVRTFTDAPSAWAWLGEPPELLRAIEQLEASHASDAEAIGALASQLRASPGLTLEEASRALGTSPRSLQRSLRGSGETFAKLRDRARAEIACARLAQSDVKLDAVASDTGFHSRSHFVAWFQRLTGLSPTAYRAQHRRR